MIGTTLSHFRILAKIGAGTCRAIPRPIASATASIAGCTIREGCLAMMIDPVGERPLERS